MAVVAFTTRANLVAGNVENIADVTSCLDALLAGVNSVADTQLVSSSNGVWRTILQASWFSNAQIAGQYFLPTGGGILSPSGTSTNAPIVIHLDPADFTLTGMTPKLRIRSQLVTNTVAPAINFIGSIQSMSLGGGASTLTTTLGGAVAGSTVTHTTPPAASSQVATGAEFTFPTAGAYAPAVQLSGAEAANTFVAGMFFLQVRWI